MLFIIVRVFDFELQFIESLTLFSPPRAVGVPCRVVISAVGAFVYVGFAVFGSMIVSTSPTFFFPSAITCFVSVPLALVALRELILRGVLLGIE